MPMKRFSQGVAPGEGEEEEGGPVDRVAQHRQASQLMEVDREVCEVYDQGGGGGVESRVSAGGGST